MTATNPAELSNTVASTDEVLEVTPEVEEVVPTPTKGKQVENKQGKRKAQKQGQGRPVKWATGKPPPLRM